VKKRVDKPTILHPQAAKLSLDTSYKLLESEDKTPPKVGFWATAFDSGSKKNEKS